MPFASEPPLVAAVWGVWVGVALFWHWHSEAWSSKTGSGLLISVAAFRGIIEGSRDPDLPTGHSNRSNGEEIITSGSALQPSNSPKEDEK